MNEKKKKKNRNIIWYNAQYSANVKTIFAKKYFKILNKKISDEDIHFMKYLMIKTLLH